jgi:hypothetical protein
MGNPESEKTQKKSIVITIKKGLDLKNSKSLMIGS